MKGASKTVKVILFDLGETLEHQQELLPGATETLQAIKSLSDSEGQAPALALISDFTMPTTPDQIPTIQQEYYAILEQLGIRQLFEPVSQMVTLSTEVGVVKPNKKIFQTAIAKIDKNLGFADAMFITEDQKHVAKARKFGMKAVHFKAPGQTNGEIDRLIDLVPIVNSSSIPNRNRTDCGCFS
jgi:FMN phosphatase YigB (HAD superfamily)